MMVNESEYPERPRIPRFNDDAQFEDTGCKLHPKCLECPRYICVYEEAHPQSAMHNELIAKRRGEGVRATDGMTEREAALKLGIGHGTIARWRAVEGRANG